MSRRTRALELAVLERIADTLDEISDALDEVLPENTVTVVPWTPDQMLRGSCRACAQSGICNCVLGPMQVTNVANGS